MSLVNINSSILNMIKEKTTKKRGIAKTLHYYFLIGKLTEEYPTESIENIRGLVLRVLDRFKTTG